MRGAEHALEVAADRKTKLFIPSSIGAFGPSTPLRNTPDTTIQRPTFLYGISKVYSELMGDWYYRNRNVRHKESMKLHFQCRIKPIKPHFQCRIKPIKPHFQCRIKPIKPHFQCRIKPIKPHFQCRIKPIKPHFQCRIKPIKPHFQCRIKPIKPCF